MKTLLINLVLKFGTELIIILIRKAADELERRKDNDFNKSNVIQSLMNGVKNVE